MTASSLDHRPFVYGLVHALVDAATVGLLFGAIALHGFQPEKAYYSVLVYSALAFALQPAVGILVDLVKQPRIAMLAGVGLVLISLGCYPFLPDAAIVLAAAGNAAFHVGAGVIAFHFTPGRAAGPGIFVAPGALGLGAGTLLGKNGLFAPLPFAGLLLAAGIALFFFKIPPVYVDREKLKIEAKLPALALGIFFIAIFARAFIGTTSGYSLERSVLALVLLSVAGFAGKALGGLAADRWGWLKVTASALLLSAPLLAFASGSLVLGAAGALLFQAAMPVTLVATAGIMPGRPGLAFGLNCLALFLGQLVDFFPLKFKFYDPLFQFAAVIATAGLAVTGLLLLPGRPGKSGASRPGRG